jgi:tRNA dimethylallyltransferase
LRERATQRGSIYLHDILKRLDRAAAANIHANDVPKLIRAIEVCVASREKMSELWKVKPDPLRGFRILRLGLDPRREELYARINERAKVMFNSGLIEETVHLFSKYADRAHPLTSLGYKQRCKW